THGRLARQQGDGGTGTLRFAYDTASYSVTDARDQVTTLFYDDSFRLRKVSDPLSHVSSIGYDAPNDPARVDVSATATHSGWNWSRDASSNPVVVGTTGGGEANLDHDAQGNPAFVQNRIGEAQASRYEPDNSRLVN